MSSSSASAAIAEVWGEPVDFADHHDTFRSFLGQHGVVLDVLGDVVGVIDDHQFDLTTGDSTFSVDLLPEDLLCLGDREWSSRRNDRTGRG